MPDKSRESKNAFLLKHLLINYKQCPDENVLPENEREWGIFMDMAHRNRLITLLYHFLICKNCAKTVSSNVKNAIQKYYLETVIRYRNYQKIKNKLRLFIRQTKTPLILIKDLDNSLIRQYYPPYYIPLKFDIDVMGKYKDLPKFRKFISKLGYQLKSYLPLGWRDNAIPQYKFRYKIKTKMMTGFEYRYKAITIFFSKKNILSQEIIENITSDFWKTIKLSTKNFSQIPEEYAFFQLCLIYYFEDHCQGLNNLFRIWLLHKHENNKLDWRKIEKMGKQHKVTTIMNFVLSLAKKEFITDASDRLGLPSKPKFLASQLINSEYICRAKLPGDNDFLNWRVGYVHFLTRGLLADEPIWQKLLFFAHPKRLFYLLFSVYT